jgi:triosephosphate isomerase
MIMRKKFIAGNWKMNTTVPEGKALIMAINKAHGQNSAVDVAVCPPFTHLEMAVKNTAKSLIRVGAQNASVREGGAYTGEVSASMIKSVDVDLVILGHSERRRYQGERDSLLNQKVKVCLKHGLDVIFCIGESLMEREIGLTNEVVLNQIELGLRGIAAEALPRVTIAYEPIWAIGTGKTAGPDEAQAVHAALRQWLSDFYGRDMAATVRILYGGSVNADNAKELLSQGDIDGALVGGASLKAENFNAIIAACI